MCLTLIHIQNLFHTRKFLEELKDRQILKHHYTVRKFYYHAGK